jgi:hypothetical protein
LPERYEEIWNSSGRSLVLLAGLEWMLLIDAFEVARAPLPSDLWMDLRYEDFVEDPTGQLRRILDHVGLPWTPEFASRLATYSLGTSRTAGYLKELSADQVRLLDDVMGEHLRRYSYVTPAIDSVIEAG